MTQKPRQKTTTEGLTRNQERALDVLLDAASVAEAARLCGLSDRTLWRYLRDPAFSEELRRRRAVLAQEATTGLAVLARRGREALAGLLEDPNTPRAILARVGIAAQDLARQALDQDDILARIDALEAAQGERGTR